MVLLGGRLLMCKRRWRESERKKNREQCNLMNFENFRRDFFVGFATIFFYFLKLI